MTVNTASYNASQCAQALALPWHESASFRFPIQENGGVSIYDIPTQASKQSKSEQARKNFRTNQQNSQLKKEDYFSGKRKSITIDPQDLLPGSKPVLANYSFNYQFINN